MRKAITLMELLLALAVTSIVILYFFAVEKIGRQDLFNTDHRAKVQNEVSYVLDHMTKNLTRTIGSTANITGQNPAVSTSTISGDAALRFFVDLASDCSSPGEGQWNTQCDRWRAYRYRPASATPTTDRYQIWYYEYCDGTDCSGAGTIGPEIIARRITAFSCAITNNYIDVTITGCWDPAEAAASGACGSANNPSVAMHAYINMPSVTAN